MNNIQRNFKKQMAEVERDLLNKEQEGHGLFKNNLYKQRFYGNSRSHLVSYRKIFIIIAIIGTVLFFTNPSKNDFTEWAKTKLYEQSKDDTEKSFMALIGKNVIDSVTVRKDYLFFSIYESSFDMGGKEKVLGICKIFIPFSILCSGDLTNNPPENSMYESDLKAVTKKLDIIKSDLNKGIDYSKCIKLKNLKGYSPDKVKKKGGKYIFAALMEYYETHTRGIAGGIDPRMDPNHLVWVLISAHKGPLEVEPGEVMIDPVFVTLYDAETGKPLESLNACTIKHFLERLKQVSSSQSPR